MAAIASAIASEYDCTTNSAAARKSVPEKDIVGMSAYAEVKRSAHPADRQNLPEHDEQHKLDGDP